MIKEDTELVYVFRLVTRQPATQARNCMCTLDYGPLLQTRLTMLSTQQNVQGHLVVSSGRRGDNSEATTVTGCVSCEVEKSSTYNKVKLSLQKAVEAHRCVSFEVGKSSTYNKVKLSP
jgi:hypothetical protein